MQNAGLSPRRLSTLQLLDGVGLSYFELDSTAREGRLTGDLGVGVAVGHVWGGSAEVELALPGKKLRRGDIFAVNVARIPALLSGASGRFSGVAILVADVLPFATTRQLAAFGVDVDRLRNLAGRQGMAVLDRCADATRAFSDLYLYTDADDPVRSRLRALEVLHVLSAPAAKASEGADRRSGLAHEARQIMTADLSRPLTIDAVAAACATSPTVLKEAFRVTFGLPIYSWYRAYRVQRSAQMLLETDLPIAQVAAAVGYASPSKFSKAFRDYMGESPSAWRRVRQG